MVEALAAEHDVDLNTPYKELPEEVQKGAYCTELWDGMLNLYIPANTPRSVSYRDEPFEGIVGIP